jgi:hypothetical protein
MASGRCLPWVSSPARRLRPIRSSMNLIVQIHQPGLSIESVFFPCHPIYTGRRISFQRQIRFPEQANIHMVEQRRELLLLASSCGFPYATQHLGHACPILSFGACFAGSHFPRPQPLAPSVPPLVAQLRSQTSQLLQRGLTSRARSSLASAHHLPHADRCGTCRTAKRRSPKFRLVPFVRDRVFDHG